LENNSIGIIGGGQLCQMLSEYLDSIGKKVYFIDPSENPPAKNTNAIHIRKDYGDKEALEFLSKNCDAITYEFENIPVESLSFLNKDISINPSPYILSISQNRLNEKTNFTRCGINTPNFTRFNKGDALVSVMKESNINFPVILKTNTLGYDGKGQYRINTYKDFENNLQFLDEMTDYIIEEVINFKKEFSVIIGKDCFGNIEYFQPIENIHKNGILDISIYPARINKEAEKNSIELATKFINEIKLTGILAIEMFLNNNDKILFNEIAPRPHNSGHLTIQSHSISQFGLLGEIVSNKKISKPLSNKKAVMKNILGEFFNKKNYKEILNEIKNMDNHYLKLYNKDEAKPGRKMGHVTIITNDIENSLVKINALID
tara:strand:+ start:3263 stop:4387 length:1125 start_codon:yes stop_codon:yes gene_type:complete